MWGSANFGIYFIDGCPGHTRGCHNPHPCSTVKLTYRSTGESLYMYNSSIFLINYSYIICNSVRGSPIMGLNKTSETVRKIVVLINETWKLANIGEWSRSAGGRKLMSNSTHIMSTHFLQLAHDRVT